MTKNRLHSRPSLAPMLSYYFVCLFIHQEFYGRPTGMATTITLPFTNSCISSWRIFTTNLVKSSWRILVSLFYRQGNRVPKRMSFLPVVTQHRTAHWGLQGSTWSCCTSLSNPITKFQSHGPSLCATKIWIHFVQTLHFSRTFSVLSSCGWLLACQGSIQTPPHQRGLPQALSPEGLLQPHYNHVILLLLLHSTHHYLILSSALIICFLFIASLIL